MHSAATPRLTGNRFRNLNVELLQQPPVSACTESARCHGIVDRSEKRLTSRCSAQISPSTSSCHLRVESRALASTALSKSSGVILAASPPSNVAGVSRRIRQLPPPAPTSLVTQLPKINNVPTVADLAGPTVSLGAVKLQLLW